MNYRIFVEKKREFNVEARSFQEELKEMLHLQNKLTRLRILNIYELFNIDAEALAEARELILSEATLDEVFDEIDREKYAFFAVEYLPGQFDQRADSAMQCLRILSEKNRNVIVKSGKLILLEGDLSQSELQAIKDYYINPVEMQEKELGELRLETHSPPEDVIVFEGFTRFTEEELEAFWKQQSLAMSLEDLKFIATYFTNEERRDPTETEIKVLDTYWSDHCRHTTFETKLKEIVIPKDRFTESIQETFEEYLKSREYVYGDKAGTRPVSLMDMATISAKEIRKKGLLEDLEISEEINACSVYIDVDVDGKIEPWLLMFKNETHNHPTEIEPFGGASTCIGGAIRDPLSGRAYVYQAIRVSGAANPLEPIEETLEGKLPQRKITQEAAHGYSSYGNQIGVATSHVREIYHPGYKAKRMEVGAVVGAVPAAMVRRESPQAGDQVIMFGGRTGRDGIGGATGSSKEHTTVSLTTAFAEVQKGNAPEERKIQKLFRRPEVVRLIKKSNDFGAGGVSVAIGELAEGLEIHLDRIRTKYAGLNGTELAISESQERMAVVVEAKDVDTFIKYAGEENLEAVVVAAITDDARLKMWWRGQKIVDISRAFLDTNGVRNANDVVIAAPGSKHPFEVKNGEGSLQDRLEKHFQDLNIASQKGLMERFDASIGAATVWMPFGGKYQETPTDVSIHKIPVFQGVTNTVSGITWGFNPELSSWSPFHGAAYAVVESIAKLAAAGFDYRRIRLSFQEYFRRLGKDPANWGLPVAALLGAQYVMKPMNIPAIGGKDSMSGSFHELHVPPTLISFAVAPGDARRMVSPEWKEKGNYLYLLKHRTKEDLMPDIPRFTALLDFLSEAMKTGNIRSATALKNGGLAEALLKSSFGNRTGFEIQYDENQLFALDYGSILVESKTALDFPDAILLGQTTAYKSCSINGIPVQPEKIKETWKAVLDPVFPEKTKENGKLLRFTPYETSTFYIAKNKIARPEVFIPAFPGTNCEYDSKRAFEKYGARTHCFTFRNITRQHIEESLEEMKRHIDNAQILMLSGGFSAGDEPEGSGKFIATVLRNPAIAESIHRFLDRDGLILGICNGFQALIKSGLLPYGEVRKISEDDPTLTFNTIGRHISRIVNTRTVSNLSPWLRDIPTGSMHQVAISHGEGRFVAPAGRIRELFENGQVAFQYADLEGNPTMNSEYNPNGSMFAIEGITSPDGRILGKMGHSERFAPDLYQNITGIKEQAIFRNGVEFFK